MEEYDQLTALALLYLAHDMVDEKRKGVTFVVGAGASQPSKLPLASELSAKLEGVFGNKLHQLLRGRGIEPENASMEAFLSAYRELADDLDAPFKFLRQYLPDVDDGATRRLPLGYVILGHFMKHGLIRHIISLNQDELLDRVLFKMLGREFFYVVSQSLFKHLHDEIERSPEFLNERMLLKPHGTIHLGATLRVELERTQRFENSKKRALERVLEGKDIVLVGYSFKDADMAELILRMAIEGRIGNFYVVSKSERLFRNSKIRGLSHLYKGQKSRCLYEIRIKKGVDKFFRELAKALYDPASIAANIAAKINQSGSPKKDINNVIAHIRDSTSFYPRINEHRVRDIILSNIHNVTLETKILIEILIIALKTRGKFKPKTLLESSWINRLIQDYVRGQCTNVASHQSNELPLSEMLKDLKKNYGIIMDSGAEAWAPEGRTYYLCGADKNTVTRHILKKLKEKLGLELNTKEEGNLLKLMKEVIDEFDYDLVTDTVHLNNFGFSEARLIRDRKQLLHVSQQIFRNSTKVEIIAETGEFLTRGEILKDIKNSNLEQITVIVSDFTNQPKDSFHYNRSEEVFRNLWTLGNKGNQHKLKLEIRVIPTEDNCHHMTLGEEKGIYFYRKDKATRFCIMEVTGKDLDIAREYYQTVKKKARGYRLD